MFLIIGLGGGTHYRIKFGFGGSCHIIPRRYSVLSVKKGAKIEFNGNARFSKGCSLRVDNGICSFGDSFSANRNCTISGSYRITFGDNVLFGWGVTVRDTEGHKIYRYNEEKVAQKPVVVGNHVWVCAFCDLLKGTVVSDGSVVAWKSIVMKAFLDENVLIGGSPAKILQDNISWEP